MKLEQARVGLRVHTIHRMTDPEHGWLAARRGSIVAIRPETRYSLLVNIDGFEKNEGPTRTNPIPLEPWEVEPGQLFPWEKE